MRLRPLSKLAAELEKTPEACIKMLAAKSIYVIDGFYDAALLEATAAEPQLAARTRVEWGLSPRLGLGMVKALLDPLGIRVVIHDPKGVQWLMLRKGAQTNYVKWQYSNTFGSKSNTCTFEVRNFLAETAPFHYMFTCFDGPFAWVVHTKILIAAWNTLQSGQPVERFAIVKDMSEHPGGALVLKLNTASSKFELSEAKQLGF